MSRFVFRQTRLCGSMNLSLSLYLSLSCNRTFRLSGCHLFTRDPIQSRCYFTRGRNRAKGRVHSPTRSPGEIGVANEKKGEGGEAEKEEEDIYIHTHTQSIVQFWLKLATWPTSRTVTKRALSLHLSPRLIVTSRGCRCPIVAKIKLRCLWFRGYCRRVWSVLDRRDRADKAATTGR